MKIMCISINYRDSSLGIIPYRSHYQNLQDELARQEDVVFYGRGKGFNQDMDIARAVSVEKPDILYFVEWLRDNFHRTFRNLQVVDTPKFLFCMDPWNNISRHIDILNRHRFNGALMLYPAAIPYYAKRTKCPLHPFPYAVDFRHFKDLGLNRDIDVFCSGSFSRKHHPLRRRLLEVAPSHKDIKFYLSSGHKLSFNEYVQKLNQSKIFCFDDVVATMDGEKINFHIEKWVEAMSCGMLAMAPAPTYAEGLGFKDGYNFVDVNIDNFMAKIEYYLENEDERRRIANNGLETIRKLHSVETRVKQMVAIFRKSL